MEQGKQYDADAIADWLVERIASELKVSPESISLDNTFFNIGLNSLNTLIITGELNELLGVEEEFSPSLFWDYPTIEKLSRHLAEQPHGTAAGVSGLAPSS